jgi:TRAP-type mannitol/chloroaromatic compound transport system permease small subunit
VNVLLRLCRGIDALNERVGRAVLWLVLAATLVSAVNALVRKLFNYSSNAYLEAQWYLFAAVFLLAAGYTLLHNEHVRIDALAQRWSRRTQVWIDVVGIVVFLLPMCVWVLMQSWPLLASAWASGETSSNTGGLLRWPLYALMPAGFGLLGLQALSELVKRLAFLAGLAPDPAADARRSAESERERDEAHRQSRSGARRP